ncbi:hypothetical protein GO001_28195 [Streptomyces sp. NRRL B-1677]|uniref:hypothetical protein n=1 Tax=Streptomyces TaxID=1883 RepID=UPI001892C2FA|nr:hypothetical protein [Streptomyces sp. NRRL B-1677]MBF6049033.1 hypothetical protein [Streptomyces sp. NRRL B-1677]
MMSEQYEYFAEVPQGYTVDRPDGLWRRSGDEWEFLSLLDWQWHNVTATNVQTPPTSEVLRAVSGEHAAALAADRQGWVQYWAHYSSKRAWGDGRPPTTVVRRRRSPENIRDESFNTESEWGPTMAAFNAFDGRTSNPPHLVELTTDEAEQLLQEIYGVTGATEL